MELRDKLSTYLGIELSHWLRHTPAPARVASLVMVRLFPAPPKHFDFTSIDDFHCAVNRPSTATMSYLTRTLGNIRKIGLKVCYLRMGFWTTRANQIL